MTETSPVADRYRPVRRWLYGVLAMIAAMVVVGGITRLTGSGLSMVEWHPLMGVLPPLSDAEWERVFAQYQASPQYELVNSWMQLADFKRIFFWEYVHRVLGRAIGAVFFLPFLAFLLSGRLRGRAAGLTSVAFALGGAQGLLGWYMVKSGLVDVPEVSHFRLAAHLGLAFVTGMYVLWLALELRPSSAEATPPRAPAPIRAALAGIAALLAVQIAWGAFMAGKRAGHVAYTFPDMNGHYGPAAFVGDGSFLGAILENPAAIHWAHRTFAYLLVLAVFVACAAIRRSEARAPVKRAATVAAAVTAAQLLLGIGVVVMRVPTWLAVTHQAGAFVLSAAIVWTAWEARLLPRGLLAGALVTAPPEPALTPVAEPQIRA